MFIRSCFFFFWLLASSSVLWAKAWPSGFDAETFQLHLMEVAAPYKTALQMDYVELLLQENPDAAEPLMRELAISAPGADVQLQQRWAFVQTYAELRKKGILEESDMESLQACLRGNIANTWLPRGYLYIGELAYDYGLYIRALDVHRKALELFQARGEQDWVFICKLRLARDYLARDLIQESEAMAEEALALADVLNVSAYQGWGALFLVHIEHVEHEYEDALKFADIAIDEFKLGEIYDGLTEAHLLKAKLYTDLSRFSDADASFAEALLCASWIEDMQLTDLIYAASAQSLLLQKEQDQAETILQQVVARNYLTLPQKADVVLEFAQNDSLAFEGAHTEAYLAFLTPEQWASLDYARQAGFHSLMADYYSSIGEYKSAYEHYKKLFDNAQSDLKLQDQREIEHLKSLHEIQSKEAQLEQLHAENELNKLARRNQSIIRNAIALIVLLLLLFLHLLYRRCSNTRQRNRELNSILEEAEKSKRDADKANEAKSVFLANMSHEIRTPMNGVVGMTDLLLRTPLSELQKEYVSLIRSSGNHLMTLINDILDLSKISAGHLELEYIPFNPANVIHHAVELVRPKMKDKPVTLRPHFHEPIPKSLIGDPTRLGQILFNLLGNAVKFTQRGFVDLDVRFEPGSAESGVLYLQVKDTGIGIPKDRCREIFNAFTQVDPSTTRKFGGSGLGLAICHHLCRMMGGHITLESEVQKGTTFRLQIPFRISGAEPLSPEADEPAAETPSPETKHHTRLLLAEDNVINRQIVLLYLEEMELEADVAHTGKQALEMTLENRYDLILMDVNMPELDGLEATRQLRRKLPPEHQPVIIGLSASAGSDDLKMALDAGMDSYITKPITYEQLEACLTQIGRPAPDSEA